MNQSSTNIKHQQLKNEFENESKMNSIINFWKNFNPRRLKVEPCSFDFEQNINFFFLNFISRMIWKKVIMRYFKRDCTIRKIQVNYLILCLNSKMRLQ